MRACVRPCQACPWRQDASAADIPGYVHTLAEGLASTSPDERGMGPEFGAPMFACHESPMEGEALACAGWLATVGTAHPGVRLAVLRGDLTGEALAPKAGWPPLHGSFQEVIAKLRRTGGTT